MDSQRSLRKIQRVQRAGVTRAAGQRRPVGFTLLLVAVVVVGVVLLVLARSSYQDAADASPRVNLPGTPGDHFHNAFGVYLCDRFIEPMADAGPDTSGIHSHDDGLIHIHPYLQSSSGKNATMGKFFEMIGLQATGDEVVLPESSEEKEKTWKSGSTTCKVGDGKDAKEEKGQWVLLEYPAQAGPDTVPTVHTDGFDEMSVRSDGLAWTLAFLPENQIDDVAEKRKGDLLPPSIETLKNPGDELEPGGGSVPPTGGEEVPIGAEVPVGEDVPADEGTPADEPAPADEAPATTAAG